MANHLKFWGTRGSCSVSGPEYQRFGGNSCCLEILYENTHLIIDAGTGIRPLGELLVKQGIRKFDLFLGHTHWDHIIGFPFFGPIYEVGSHITIWAPTEANRSCREIFAELLSSEFFPVRLEQVQAQIDFRTIHAKTPIRLGPLEIDFHSTAHPGLTYCFKIKTPHQTISYVTDNEVLQGYHGSLEDVPDESVEPHLSLIDFLSSSDLLIHEAQYLPNEYLSKVGWGHSSLLNSIALVQRAKIRHWLVSHHDPKHSDDNLLELEATARRFLKETKTDCDVSWIGDGHVVSLK